MIKKINEFINYINSLRPKQNDINVTYVDYVTSKEGMKYEWQPIINRHPFIPNRNLIVKIIEGLDNAVPLKIFIYYQIIAVAYELDLDKSEIISKTDY